MKILIVSPFENNSTGRGDRNLRLADLLRRRGNEVTFVTSNFDHGLKSHIPQDKIKGQYGVKILKVPGYFSNVGFARILCHMVFALKLLIWGFGKRWDRVVVSSIPPEALFAARLLRKDKFIVDVRDIWPDALQAYGRQSMIMRLFGLYCALIYRAVLKHADVIMMVAPAFRLWIKRYIGMKLVRTKFVPLGFRREDFRPVSKQGSEYSFCYAGGATPQFDIREFSTDFANEKGVVLGDGPLLDAWKITFKKTEFLGVVPRPLAMSFMAKSQQLLFPSNPYAQLPNKAFDYFALGLHVTLGDNCTRATRYLLMLRRRRFGLDSLNDDWTDYRSIEKEAITERAADIIEGRLGKVCTTPAPARVEG